MEAALNHMVPEAWNGAMFEHVDEGPDDMPAHVKSTLFGATLTVPVTADGRANTFSSCPLKPDSVMIVY